jgi:hypothetical protein
MLHARMDYQRIQDPAGLIPDAEPVFLIRGQDEIGSMIVRAWADEYQKRGGDPVIADSARAQAILMDAWPTKKAADVPEGTPIATATAMEPQAE